MANILEQFPSENGVEKPSPDRFILAQAPSTGPTLIPWSNYIPFAEGQDLAVDGKIFLIPFVPISFSGSAKIDTFTDTQLDFSVIIPPIKLPAIFDFDMDKLTISAKITYVAEGSSNKAVFSFGGADQEKTVHIQSKPNERILTPPGGLQIKTLMPSPAPETVELQSLHMVPSKDQVELGVFMAFPIPNFTITVTKRT